MLNKTFVLHIVTEYPAAVETYLFCCVGGCHNRSHISVARFRSNVLVLPVPCCTEVSE